VVMMYDFPPLSKGRHDNEAFGEHLTSWVIGSDLGGPLFTAGVGKKVVMPSEPGMSSL